MPSLKAHVLNSTAWAIFIQTLAEDGGTVNDLSEESGLSAYTVRRVLHAMHKRGAAHITSWEKDTLGRHTVRSWKLGRKKDAVRPPAKASIERCREYYVKQQQVAAVTGGNIRTARVAGMKRNMFGVLEAA